MATTLPPRPNRGKRRLFWAILILILLVAAFLFGFIPEYRQVSQLQAELQTARQDQRNLAVTQRLCEVRDQFHRLYLETTRNNFGIASQHATQAFDQLNSLLQQNLPADEKKTFQDVASRRDQVMTGLAKADPGVRTLVASLLDQIDSVK